MLRAFAHEGRSRGQRRAIECVAEGGEARLYPPYGLHPWHHHLPSGFVSSSGKYFSTLSSGLGAAWPSPQIEASRMASDSSVNSAGFHGPFAIRSTAFSVPTRHGVHWPQLSSSKNFIRLSATAFISSWSH